MWQMRDSHSFVSLYGTYKLLVQAMQEHTDDEVMVTLESQEESQRQQEGRQLLQIRI